MVLSPTLRPKFSAAPGPNSTTVPKNSWPGTTGAFTQLSQSEGAPMKHLPSLPQMPAASILMMTSPRPALGFSIFSNR